LLLYTSASYNRQFVGKHEIYEQYRLTVENADI